MTIFPSLPLKYSLKVSGELEAEANGIRVGSLFVLGMLILLIPAIVEASIVLSLIIIVAIGPIALFYFVFHEYLFISATHIDYHRKSIWGSRAVRSDRDSLIAIRLFAPKHSGGKHGGPSRTFEVDLLFFGARLPSSLKLFESVKESSARTVARQIDNHLSLPVKDVI
jgi:hypothetical protein